METLTFSKERRKMQVSKVFVHPYQSGRLLGFADVILSLDDSKQPHMTWSGVKLFQSDNGGVHIGLPSKKDEKGKVDENQKPIYHPVIKLARDEENPGPADAFYEMLRVECEKAYKSMSEEKSKPKPDSPQPASNDDVGEKDLPF
jgi:DNA-binding cell septation regulator SpoVG